MSRREADQKMYAGLGRFTVKAVFGTALVCIWILAVIGVTELWWGYWGAMTLFVDAVLALILFSAFSAVAVSVDGEK